MKSMATAIAIAAVLVVAGAAGANMLLTGFTWAGTSTDKWALDGNWTAAGYPGQTGGDNSDSATIADGSPQATVIVNATITDNVNFVVVDAETADADMTLKIVSGGDLDVLNSGAGYVQLIGGTDPSGMPPAVFAKLWYAAGNFDVDDLDLDGGTPTSTRGDGGLAIVVWDVARTIGDDVDVTGDVDFDAAADITVSGDFTIGDGTTEADMDKQSAGDVTVTGKIIIKGGSSADTVVTVSAGSLLNS